MKNLSVLDADSVCFAVIWKNSDANPAGMYQEVSRYVESILAATNADYYLGFLGGEGNFRKEVAKSRPYKGSRKEEPESVKYWKPLIRQFLVDHWGFVQCHGIEADDACSIAHKKYSQDYNITVCGCDWDLDQIPGKHWNYNKGLAYSLLPYEASYNFHHQLLTGCSGDNVSGCPKWGEVKSTKLLQPFLDFKSLPLDQFEEELRRAVTGAYFTKLGEDWLPYYTEQYTLLKLLDCGEKYGFTCPSPVPVPTTSLIAEEVDISHLFV